MHALTSISTIHLVLDRILDLLARLRDLVDRLVAHRLRLCARRLFPAHVVVVDVPVSLDELRGEVDGVAAEEEVVCGRDGQGVAHESARVEGEGARHAAGDAGVVLVLVGRGTGRVVGCGGKANVHVDVHLRVLAHVCDRGNRDAEVAHGAPEI